MMLKTAAYHARILGAALALIALSCDAFTGVAQTSNGGSEGDSLTINLPFPFGGEDPFNPIASPAGFDFAWPSNFTYEIVLDDETGMYSIQRSPGRMSCSASVQPLITPDGEKVAGDPRLREESKDLPSSSVPS